MPGPQLMVSGSREKSREMEREWSLGEKKRPVSDWGSKEGRGRRRREREKRRDGGGAPWNCSLETLPTVVSCPSNRMNPESQPTCQSWKSSNNVAQDKLTSQVMGRSSRAEDKWVPRPAITRPHPLLHQGSHVLL